MIAANDRIAFPVPTFAAITIHFNTETFYSNGGLQDLAFLFCDPFFGQTSTQLFFFRDSADQLEIHAAAYGNHFANDEDHEGFSRTTMKSWVNGTATPGHGSHVSGFQRVLYDVHWFPHVLMIHLVTKNPNFSGRTKGKLVSLEIKNKVYQSLYAPLKRYIDKYSKDKA